jgi:hypothetical protein
VHANLTDDELLSRIATAKELRDLGDLAELALELAFRLRRALDEVDCLDSGAPRAEIIPHPALFALASGTAG